MSGNKYLGLLLCLSLVACGGGGSDSPTTGSSAPSATSVPSASTAPNAAKSVSGVAAYGAALANADIVIKGANGKTVMAKADANGKWTVADVRGLTAPLIIQAKGTVGGVTQELYSVLTTAPLFGPVTANVTPLTTALLSQAAGITPATLFADPAKIAAVNPAKVDAAKAKLLSALSDYITALGVDASKVDLISTTFEANSKGLDKLMDLVKISSNGTGDTTEIEIKDTVTGSKVRFKPSETPKVLPKPSPETVALDIAGIRTLLAEFNAVLKTKAGVDSKAFEAFWDEAYLHQGWNKAQDVAEVREEYKLNPTVAWQASLIEVLGCKQNVCQLGLNFTNAKGQSEIDSDHYLKQGADGKWRFYGDQQKNGAGGNGGFASEFEPRAIKEVMLDAQGNVVNSRTKANIQFYARPGNDEKIGCAKFYAKGKADSNWTKYFQIDGYPNSSQLDWRYEAPSNIVNELNSKIDAGGAMYRVETFANADCTGTTKSYDQSLNQRFYLPADLSAVKFPTVTAADLGTNRVRFAPVNAIDVRIQVVDSDNGNLLTNSQWDGSSASALNGEVTVAKAQAMANQNGGNWNWSNGVITSISVQDENGSMIQFRRVQTQ